MKMTLCLFLLSIGLSSNAQSKINVSVSKLENNKGNCIVCLYDNAKAYAGKGSPIKCITAGISNKFASVQFDNVAAGTYAISVIHDANNNQKFDTNFLGIPTEGYGASQNKLPFAAAPKFDANKFSVSANTITSVAIKLRYLF